MSGPTETQGEHEFAIDILISGDEIRGYTSDEPLERAEPLEIVDDYAVGPSGGDAFVGLAAYTVAAGEEVAVLGDDCEVRLEAGEAIEAGDDLTVDDGAFVHAGADDVKHAVANSGGGAGDYVEAYISASTGNEAV